MFRGIGFRAAIIFLIILTSSFVFGQSRTPSFRVAPKPAPAPFMLEAESHEELRHVSKTVFKNGLTVFVYEAHAQPLVSIRAYVSGGFLDDPDKAIGISELTARARENIGAGSPNGAIRRRAQALGGVFNVRAGPRYSCFGITVPAARWKQALNIQAEVMLSPFENNEALRRYAIRIAENVRDESAPSDDIVREELHALAFGERRFAAAGDLVKIDSEKVIDFHKNRYVLPAMTLVIAGDVRAGEALNEAIRVFVSKSESAKNGNISVAAPATGRGLEPAGEFRYRALSGNIAFPRVFFGFPVSSEKSEDYSALEVAAAILGIGETSILNTRLCDRKNLVFTARAGIESFDGTGILSVELETELQNIDMAEIAFWTEVEILKRDGPSETELARAAAQLERLWWGRRETVDGLADLLAVSEFKGDWKRIDGYIAEIKKITSADVKRVITRYFTLSNCALMEHLPLSSTERNPTAKALRATFESLLRPAINEELRARIGEIEPVFKIPPAGAVFRSNEVRHSFQTASILRGPEIYIREDHTSPLVEIGLWFTGGKALEGEANAGITGIMLELMLGNERENRQLEIYGGRLTPVIADDYFGFFLSIPARNISGGFERIKQAIKSPVFDKAEIEKMKQIAVARAKSSAFYGGGLRRLNEALFRGHTYAYGSSATSASLKNISVETLRDWYEENVRNVKPFVAIIGDTEGSSIASWFVSEFSGSRMREGKKVASSPKPVVKTEIVYNDGALPSAILLGFQAPSAGDKDVYRMFVLKNYLENRLRETEDKGEKNQDSEAAGRHISCEYRPLLRSGIFFISAAAKTGAQARGAEILGKEVAGIAAQPLSYADFNEARALAAGSFMAGNQTRSAQIENLTKKLLAGGSLEEYQNFSRNLEQVGEEDLKELMRRVLDMNIAVTVIKNGGDR